MSVPLLSLNARLLVAHNNCVVVQVYHPNIDLEGNVCLNILREDWKPVLSVSSIIYGLQYLFLDPNPDDPLNKEAAEALRQNARAFEGVVRRSLGGGYIGSTYFPPALA